MSRRAPPAQGCTPETLRGPLSLPGSRSPWRGGTTGVVTRAAAATCSDSPRRGGWGRRAGSAGTSPSPPWPWRAPAGDSPIPSPHPRCRGRAASALRRKADRAGAARWAAPRGAGGGTVSSTQPDPARPVRAERRRLRRGRAGSRPRAALPLHKPLSETAFKIN